MAQKFSEEEEEIIAKAYLVKKGYDTNMFKPKEPPRTDREINMEKYVNGELSHEEAAKLGLGN